MPRPGGPGGHNAPEKSKDFFGSMKRLLSNLKPWKFIMIMALVLAMISAILSLIAPNKLSDFADEISKGLVPNTDKLQEISTKMSSYLTSEKITKKLNNLSSDETLSTEEKQEIIKAMQDLSSTDQDSIKEAFLSLPDNVLEYFLDDIKIDNVTITKKDQLEMMNLVSEMNGEVKTEKALEIIDKLPKSVYKLVKPTIDMDKIKKIALTMAIIYLTSAIFSYIQGFSMTTVSNNFAKKLRSNISDKINKLPLRYFDNHETGDVLSRVTNDVDTISQNLNNSLATLVTSITLFLGSILMMFITNWVMALTAIIASLIGFSFMFILLGKSQKYFSMRQTELGNLNGYIEEIYSGHNVVKAYNGTDEAIEEFSKLNNKLYEANRKSVFLSGLMQPIMGFVGNFGYVAVCIVGALLALNGYITFGVIVAFMIYIRLFTNPLSQIAQAMTNLQSTAAASERVFEFLDEEEMPKENAKTHLHRHKVKGEIEFKNVKFGYNPERTIIKNFSAKAHPGEKIAIVGPTGAGKTTMVNLLMKFYDITSGEILIDGVSTKDLTRENIHKLFVMVLQDTWLFDGTVRDNIKFNQKDITDNEIWEVCKTVGVDHFIKTLPGGLDAKLDDNDSISSGQKQLLTIARGMVEDAPFLILDEATSNVDTRTEELVQKAMDKLAEGRTSFIIAHRLSTIKNADLILVMNEGNIIEQGNHEELLKKGGFYADLYNSQFQK
jgi:ATP-binding cassette subfamily B protein